MSNLQLGIIQGILTVVGMIIGVLLPKASMLLAIICVGHNGLGQYDLPFIAGMTIGVATREYIEFED